MQTPVMQTPVMQTPVMQTPVMQTPVMQTPVMQTPIMQTPIMQTPIMQTPIMQTPIMQTPVMQTPVMQTPVMQTPVMQTHQEPKYGCLRNGTKPCYREYFNKTLKKTSNKKLVKRRKIQNKKYVVGKNKKNKSINVLIKNNKTRKVIQKDFSKLKTKPIEEIKQELFKKNLIKIGTISPPDVLRTIYEQSMLAGDIHNVQKNISLHNFLNKEENI